MHHLSFHLLLYILFQSDPRTFKATCTTTPLLSTSCFHRYYRSTKTTSFLPSVKQCLIHHMSHYYILFIFYYYRPSSSTTTHATVTNFFIVLASMHAPHRHEQLLSYRCQQLLVSTTANLLVLLRSFLSSITRAHAKIASPFVISLLTNSDLFQSPLSFFA